MFQEKVRERAKKGIFRIVFSRAGLFLLLILLQLSFFIISTFYIAQYGKLISAFLRVLGIVVVISIINAETNPAFKLTWILFVMTFPIMGTLFYIYTETQWTTKKMRLRLDELKLQTSKYMIQDKKTLNSLLEDNPANAQLSTYLSKFLQFPCYRNTDVEYYPSGEAKFKALLKELKHARKYIFMEYFIVDDGYMWDSVLEILYLKVQEGVEVRVIYDGMCAINNLPYGYPKELEKYGIQCKMSNPVIPFMSTIQNNRDHRKICVVDGRVAFTGGVNLADEYINKIERFGHWKDTAIKIEGDAVQSFTMMFLEMWNVNERRPERINRYLTPKSKVLQEELGYVIPYADSPFDHENVGEEVYFHILDHAKKYVHIMTPYLILDNEMMTTLTRAAKGGIDVSIIMPHIPDKWYAFVLAKTYYKELIQAGVQIYEYTPGFVHAKVFVSDDDTATVGSINMDFRSLYLHFECGAFIYKNDVVGKIEADFQKTLKKCHKVTLVEVENRSLFNKIMGQILRLIAPLM